LVIRSTGTSTGPFTIEADDCGEPGTADTFRITTMTYSHRLSTLIGGNLQLHKEMQARDERRRQPTAPPVYRVTPVPRRMTAKPLIGRIQSFTGSSYCC
jgi:hypothetical protein